ncbi:dTDP-4-dehydrorhamnose 3,5-epimerase [Xenorhabdus sp. KK7.4]|uniref:dTDP-4-dehydrorhamnose 3,5-epimerase n=1 Tax=Xenorhabdus sp. KK7.4 TaxID=1851572 RepID=UPI000C04E108|nr:dTDP-4-dehydrorhamnose 3,5-epimerase [Xenorhabdus sp. KK7.4]PHM58609.1 dTDP-4-deoxyrhamnose 3,5 epimerase [Xenorhabdus sp. KK7.4]
MNVIKTSIPEVLILEPQVFGDNRGFFFESFNKKIFEDVVGYPVNFVQDNHSKSTKGVLRGLHFQKAPYAQGKLVRCTVGEVFDVAVDIRQNSPTFGEWVGAYLSAENKRQLWIPEGFAHGFFTKSSVAELLYKATNFYHPNFEDSVIWNDKSISINWPIGDIIPILSPKDSHALSLDNLELN